MAKKNAPAAAATADDVEVIAKPGLGIDEGIILTTFFVMIGAIMLVIMANKAYGV